MLIKYVKGDATTPREIGNKVITHVCNDIGGWGKGFVMALSARWKEPELAYRQWFRSKANFNLGEVQLVAVTPDTWVANMLGQRDVKKGKDGKPPVRYEAIKLALEKVASFAKENQASIHMPRIGCGLAGGSWEIMEKIIEESLTKHGLAVTVYDL